MYKLTNEELMAEVLNKLPREPDGMTTSKLSRITGFAERTIRCVIAKLREDGHMIVNLQDGKGFFILDEESKDPNGEALDLIARQYRQDTNRAMNILKRRKHMRKLLKAAGREV